MMMMGLQLPPRNESLQEKIEVFIVGSIFFTITMLGYLLWLIFLSLAIYGYWWLLPPLIYWMYLDRSTCETGGRISYWVQNWAWWAILRKYLQAKMVTVPDFKLDVKKNYLFCCYPHGVLPAGPYANIITQHSEFARDFPRFKRYFTILKQMFFTPFARDIILGMGGIAPSAESLRYVLGDPKGGNVVGLHPGGALEAALAHPNVHKFVVKQRKGFVKIALTTGAPLVPVITFGETDLYEQMDGWLMKKFQHVVRKRFGFTPVVMLGRGVFQMSFGMTPRQTLLTTVMGKPLEVAKVANPTKEQIDELHETFVQELVALFEEYKGTYLRNGKNAVLELL